MAAAAPLPLRAAERLDRGAIAVPLPEGGWHVSWRLLESDPAEVSFDLRRADADDPASALLTRIVPATGAIVPASLAGADARFVLETRLGPAIPAARTPLTRLESGGFVRLPLRGTYRAQKVGLADFDGDGALDYLVKQPDFNVDPYQQPGYWKKSEDTYKLEAYRSDGTPLWRYDLGWAIEEGIWYSPILTYDLDGDGRAEVYTKAGEGDPRDADGRVTSGPEWLVKLDGRTGDIVRRLPWPDREGFDDYNYYCRNFLGVAYLDGRRPHLIVQRGTYRLIKLQAYDPDLNLVWSWAATGPHAAYRGQGAHGIQVADLDADGRDELVIGSAAIDDNGQPLWTTGLGHPDVCYVADIDPSRRGLEVFFGIEPARKQNAVCLADAQTGKLLWGYDGPTKHVHGQGMVGDIDPAHPGLECYAGEKDGSNYWLYSARGKRLSDQSLGELAPKAVYWGPDATKAVVVRNRIQRYQGPALGQIEGRVVAIADCLGDWREEILTALEGEVRVYTSPILAASRRVCLMQDRQYRTAVAMQTMGYFYPPQLGVTPLKPEVPAAGASRSSGPPQP